MAAPKNVRLSADFDEWFPQGLYLVGEIVPGDRVPVPRGPGT